MPAQSHIVTPQRAHELAYNNLIRVFGERDSTKRKAVIPETYTKDVLMFDPGDELFQGHDKIHDRVGSLLAEREGWEFNPVGAVKLNADLVYLAWVFGPRGSDGEIDVKVTGSDHLIVKQDSDGQVRISKLYVVLDAAAEVKL